MNSLIPAADMQVAACAALRLVPPILASEEAEALRAPGKMKADANEARESLFADLPRNPRKTGGDQARVHTARTIGATSSTFARIQRRTNSWQPWVAPAGCQLKAEFVPLKFLCSRTVVTMDCTPVRLCTAMREHACQLRHLCEHRSSV